MRSGAVLSGMVAVIVTGCANTIAPVVDRPVWDTPAVRAPSPRGEPVAQPSAAPTGSPQPAAAGAAGRDPADPDWRPDVYSVKPGDTLYSIALDHGLAYRDLAAWNDLSDPNVIRVNQQLKLKPPPGWVERIEAEGAEVIARAVTPPPAVEVKPLEPPAPVLVITAPKALKIAYSDEALAKLRGEPFNPKPVTAERAAPAPAPATGKPPAAPPAATPAKPAAQVAAAPASKPAGARPGGIDWVWPVRGKLLHAFNQGSNPKGVAIGGELGQPVLASAAGKVVYSGSGLRGYGKLVIIKHDNTYLSVYAHNRELLVKEGQRVNQGQKIAEMGNTDAGRVGLHFEIRQRGKPVDPLQYLPAPNAS